MKLSDTKVMRHSNYAVLSWLTKKFSVKNPLTAAHYYTVENRKARSSNPTPSSSNDDQIPSWSARSWKSWAMMSKSPAVAVSAGPPGPHSKQAAGHYAAMEELEGTVPESVKLRLIVHGISAAIAARTQSTEFCTERNRRQRSIQKHMADH